MRDLYDVAGGDVHDLLQRRAAVCRGRSPVAGQVTRMPSFDSPFVAASLLDTIPDVRDGLTRIERVVLHVLHETQKERGDRNVPTVMLWGRVCEHVYISPHDLSELLARLGARR